MTKPSSEGSLCGPGNRGEVRRRTSSFVSVLATVVLGCVLIVVPAAVAATTIDGGQGNEQATQARSPSPGNGDSHAAENAERGMNRESGPGEWKENGHEPSANSSPQGFAPSDPDNGGNNGLDKPGETGGFDADRDGNNGCGNDDDAEDDNNGWCGKPPFAVSPGGRVSPTPTVSPSPTVSPTAGAIVLGKVVRAPAAAPEILGLQVPGLAVTGVAVAGLFVTAIVLTLMGLAVRRASSRRSRSL